MSSIAELEELLYKIWLLANTPQERPLNADKVLQLWADDVRAQIHEIKKQERALDADDLNRAQSIAVEQLTVGDRVVMSDALDFDSDFDTELVTHIEDEYGVKLESGWIVFDPLDPIAVRVDDLVDVIPAQTLSEAL